jgi:hypothetical protein
MMVYGIATGRNLPSMAGAKAAREKAGKPGLFSLKFVHTDEHYTEEEFSQLLRQSGVTASQDQMHYLLEVRGHGMIWAEEERERAKRKAAEKPDEVLASMQGIFRQLDALKEGTTTPGETGSHRVGDITDRVRRPARVSPALVWMMLAIASGMDADDEPAPSRRPKCFQANSAAE